MATKSIGNAQDIYQLKVTLLGTNPTIWQRLLVPADLTLAQFHNVLQAAMGWDNQHLHQFRAGQRRFGRPEPSSPFNRRPPVESERTARLSAVLHTDGAKMIHTYDFGDNWEHGILLEKHLRAEPHANYPICTEGQIACPPEDCGGIPGYYDLIDALVDSRHARHEELRDWIGGEFNPKEFPVEKVNRLLSPAHQRSKIRASEDQS